MFVHNKTVKIVLLVFYFNGANWSLPTPHKGHTQSSGRSANDVPGSMLLSGSPTSGSYTQSHTSHSSFFPNSKNFLVVILECI